MNKEINNKINRKMKKRMNKEMVPNNMQFNYYGITNKINIKLTFLSIQDKMYTLLIPNLKNKEIPIIIKKIH